MKRIAKHSVCVEPGVYKAPGEEIELTKPQEAELDRLGALHSKFAEKKPDAGPIKPKGQALTEAIAARIGGLDKDEGFTGAGLPNVAALEKALGYDIAAAERDAAWEAYRAANPGLFDGK